MRSTPQLVGERAGMQRTAPAQRQKGELARIVALPDRYEADTFRHLRVDDAVDAERGLLDGEVQRAGDHALDRARG